MPNTSDREAGAQEGADLERLDARRKLWPQVKAIVDDYDADKLSTRDVTDALYALLSRPAPAVAQPVAWMVTYKGGGKAFYGSLEHAKSVIMGPSSGIVITPLYAHPPAGQKDYDVLDSLDWNRLRSGDYRALNPDNQPLFDQFYAGQKDE